MSSKSKLQILETITFLKTNLKLETIALGDTTLFCLDCTHNFYNAQKIHHELLLQFDECFFVLKHLEREGVYSIICITALKKHVLPRL